MSFFRLKLPLLAVVGIVTAVGAASIHGNEATPTAVAPPPPEVDVAAVVQREVTDWRPYSGRLEAVDSVEVRPQVSGPIVAVHFQSGALVKKGDPLFTIDPAPFQAEVDRAQAQVAASQAQVTYANADLQRAERLVQSQTLTRQTLDERQNTASSAVANLRAAQAALEIAKLNLGYTNVTAPISGRVSRAEMTVGNVVAAGAAAAPLTSLVSVSPIYASFDVDEQTYLSHIASEKDARGVPVRLGLINEDNYPRTGTVEHVDNQLDTRSGTIRVRAKFDNPDGRLVPGLYARILVGGSSAHNALLVDDRAVGTDQDKKFVLVIGAEDKVEYRPIRVGGLQDGLRVVMDGLSAGERIVVNGLQHARPGDRIRPKDVAMGSDPAKTATAMAP
jgi:membrane fusion protein, multidrug efflux system